MIQTTGPQMIQNSLCQGRSEKVGIRKSSHFAGLHAFFSVAVKSFVKQNLEFPYPGFPPSNGSNPNQIKSTGVFTVYSIYGIYIYT